MSSCDNDDRVVMITGQDFLGAGFYNRNYSSQVRLYAAVGARFLVCSDDGIGACAQKHLAELCKAGELHPERVTVFNTGKDETRQLQSFQLRNGFDDDDARDLAMCNECTEQLCKLSDYRGAVSSSTLNVLRNAFGGDENKAQTAFKALRSTGECLNGQGKEEMLIAVTGAYHEIYNSRDWKEAFVVPRVVKPFDLL